MEMKCPCRDSCKTYIRIERILEVMDVKGEVTVSEIVHETNFPIAAVYRLIHKMTSLGILQVRKRRDWPAVATSVYSKKL